MTTCTSDRLPLLCRMSMRGLLSLAVVAPGLRAHPVLAQGTAETTQSSSCVLSNQVYTCDSTVFEKSLNDAKTVAIETHSVDKFAQAQLKNLLVKKLGKTLVPDGSPTDLIFILVPLGASGMNMSPGEVQLGTIQVYSATPDGRRSSLVWVETYSGSQDLPWPAVVNSLLSQFQKHFHIK